MTKPSRAQRIADLNDKFRKSLVTGGRTYMTAGVNAKGPEFVAKALAKVIAFDDFNADNDPHREHDFGSFELEGEKLFWKIDLYERELVRQTLTGTPYEHRLIEGTVHQGRVYPKTCRTRAAPGTPLPCQLRKVFACYASIGLSRCEPLNVVPLKP